MNTLNHVQYLFKVELFQESLEQTCFMNCRNLVWFSAGSLFCPSCISSILYLPVISCNFIYLSCALLSRGVQGEVHSDQARDTHTMHSSFQLPAKSVMVAGGVELLDFQSPCLGRDFHKNGRMDSKSFSEFLIILQIWMRLFSCKIHLSLLCKSVSFLGGTSLMVAS